MVDAMRMMLVTTTWDYDTITTDSGAANVHEEMLMIWP